MVLQKKLNKNKKKYSNYIKLICGLVIVLATVFMLMRPNENQKKDLDEGQSTQPQVIPEFKADYGRSNKIPIGTE